MLVPKIKPYKVLALPNKACSGLAGTWGAKGQVINPPTANASRYAY